MFITYAVIVAVLTSLACHIRERSLYRWDRRNPYRRYCARCGQQQERHAYSMRLNGTAWWEPMGRVKNPACRCHGDCQYR